MKSKILNEKVILGFLKYVLITFLLVTIIFPLVWLVSGSFKMEKEILQYPPTVFGTKYTLKSVERIFNTIPVMAYVKNTLIFSIGASALAILFDSMAGYAFAHLKFKGKNTIFVIVLITMMVPFQITMIPLFLEMNYMHLLNSYVGLIIPKATTAFGIFMMRSYFQQISGDLCEAARIDGMGEFKIFFKIMLPLVKPGIMTLAIFHLMNNWNDLLYPLMMTTETKMRTLSAGLALFVGERATTYFGPQLAGALIAITPLLILYIFFQKYFVASVAATGLKE